MFFFKKRIKLLFYAFIFSKTYEYRQISYFKIEKRFRKPSFGIDYNVLFLPRYFSPYKEINFNIKHVSLLPHLFNDVPPMKVSFLDKYMNSTLKTLHRHY